MEKNLTSPRNVLVIAYYFPPMGLSGVQRILKFVRYLPQFNWRPTVVTVTATGYYAQDYSLLEELRSNHTEIIRVGSLDPNRLFRRKGVVKMPSEKWRKIFNFISDTFFIPDNKIGWKKKAVKASEELFKTNDFDVIFTTAPPFTDFLVGLELHKKFRKPLVVDYRDPWHDYPYKYYPTLFHKWRNYKLEKKVLRASSRILVTGRRTKELILKRFKFLHYNDVTILTHGYDPADFEPGKQIEVNKTGRMRITHAGVFYGDRTPKHFLLALKNIIAAQPEMANEIELILIGNLQDEHLKFIKSLGLEGIVTITGYLDHQHCISYLKSSDLLWLTLNNDLQTPGKVYEYLGLRKPILACVPEGFVRQTLEEAGGSTIVEPTDVSGIAAAVLQLHALYEGKNLPEPDEGIVRKYDRIELTNELSKVFGFLVKE